MMRRSCVGRTTLSALALSVLLAVPALADGATDAPTFEYSFNIGAQSDYVFRGVSQSAGNPVMQGGVDIGYGMFYAGVWASGVDFGDGTLQANTEVDFYAGIKPELGPVTFDLGIIYYAYLGTKNETSELDYIELKLGASTSIDKFSFGVTGFYSPEYTGEVGSAITVEGTVGYELPALAFLTPSITATLGTVQFQDAGNIDYNYWNAGLSMVAAEKLTLDFRYWDTDGATTDCSTAVFGCDERFVASVKLTLP